MTIKLHCFGESGNAYKAALALELSGLAWEPVFVDFFGGEGRSPEFRAKNIMGEVPLLEDGDIRLTQSGVIQQYITDKAANSAAHQKTNTRSCAGFSGTTTKCPPKQA